ncbi:chorismate mutase [Candidatus Bathyarchaeota archaeon]|nr:chorismate mutase [Candidatus Bathyarchaeota archaeon]
MKYEDEITEPRKIINRLNQEIILKIKERSDIAKKIAEIKRKYNKPIVDPDREKVVLSQVRSFSLEQNLDPDRVESIFVEIIKLCVETEENLI